MSEKLVLIDGHSILNRALYGVPDLTNTEGLHTNAIYGFLNIMFKIIEEEDPTYLAVAFDLSAPTFRHKMYDAYKGTRKPMPQELREQVPVMKEVLSAMGILTMEQEGFEADDILGTMAKRAEKEGVLVALVSGDRDLLQIATDKIKIRIPKTKGARTEIEDYYAKDVEEKYHVNPQQFIELKALMGDTADNIPGVPKVGEKTATALMEQYGSIENIYAHLEEISKNSIRTSLAENRELADLSKKLATIDIDAPIRYTLADARTGNFYTPEAYAYMKKLAFKNMLSRFDAQDRQESDVRENLCITEMQKAEEIFALCEKAEKTAFYVLGESVLLSCGQENYYIPAQGFLTFAYLQGKLQELFEACKKEGHLLLTFDVKKFYGLFTMERADVSCFFDTKLAAYLLNPLKSEYTLEDIAQEYRNVMLMDYKQQFGKKSVAESMETEEEMFTQYAGGLIQTIYDCYEKLADALSQTA